MSVYDSGLPFQLNGCSLTIQEAKRVFQLTPAPPPIGDSNGYIITAVQKHDLQYFLFFLHQYEPRLNSRISRFLLREGLDPYDPERFMDYKQSCFLVMLECLGHYDPDMGAKFATYVHHPIGNALLRSRMQGEGGSFSSLDEYKRTRGIAWLYHETGKSESEVIAEYAEQENCSEKTAETYLSLARANRNRVPFYNTIQDADSEEIGEDVTRDDSWDYSAILWNGIQADAVRAAFEKLSYREQRLLEEWNSICMTCGRVSSISKDRDWGDLAIMFEGSSNSGAERAYQRAVEKLAVLLVKDGLIHAVRVKRVSIERVKKKITTAVYEYQADCDGKWGEIQFDFETGTAKIMRRAEWDTTSSNVFAKSAIRRILQLPERKLPANAVIAFAD